MMNNKKTIPIELPLSTSDEIQYNVDEIQYKVQSNRSASTWLHNGIRRISILHAVRQLYDLLGSSPGSFPYLNAGGADWLRLNTALRRWRRWWPQQQPEQPEQQKQQQQRAGLRCEEVRQRLGVRRGGVVTRRFYVRCR
jgi:hypothetical protein